MAHSMDSDDFGLGGGGGQLPDDDSFDIDASYPPPQKRTAQPRVGVGSSVRSTYGQVRQPYGSSSYRSNISTPSPETSDVDVSLSGSMDQPPYSSAIRGSGITRKPSAVSSSLSYSSSTRPGLSRSSTMARSRFTEHDDSLEELNPHNEPEYRPRDISRANTLYSSATSKPPLRAAQSMVSSGYSIPASRRAAPAEEEVSISFEEDEPDVRASNNTLIKKAQQIQDEEAAKERERISNEQLARDRARLEEAMQEAKRNAETAKQAEANKKKAAEEAKAREEEERRRQEEEEEDARVAEEAARLRAEAGVEDDEGDKYDDKYDESEEFTEPIKVKSGNSALDALDAVLDDEEAEIERARKQFEEEEAAQLRREAEAESVSVSNSAQLGTAAFLNPPWAKSGDDGSHAAAYDESADLDLARRRQEEYEEEQEEERRRKELEAKKRALEAAVEDSYDEDQEAEVAAPVQSQPLARSTGPPPRSVSFASEPTLHPAPTPAARHTHDSIPAPASGGVPAVFASALSTLDPQVAALVMKAIADQLVAQNAPARPATTPATMPDTNQRVFDPTQSKQAAEDAWQRLLNMRSAATPAPPTHLPPPPLTTNNVPSWESMLAAVASSQLSKKTTDQDRLFTKRPQSFASPAIVNPYSLPSAQPFGSQYDHPQGRYVNQVLRSGLAPDSQRSSLRVENERDALKRLLSFQPGAPNDAPPIPGASDSLSRAVDEHRSLYLQDQAILNSVLRRVLTAGEQKQAAAELGARAQLKFQDDVNAAASERKVSEGVPDDGRGLPANDVIRMLEEGYPFAAHDAWQYASSNTLARSVVLSSEPASQLYTRQVVDRTMRETLSELLSDAKVIAMVKKATLKKLKTRLEFDKQIQIAPQPTTQQNLNARASNVESCRNGLSASDAASLERAQSDRRKATHIKQKQLEEDKLEQEEKKAQHNHTRASSDDADGDDEFRMGSEEIYQEDGEFAFRTVVPSSSSIAASSSADLHHDPSLPAATAKATRILQSQFNLLTTLQSQFTASSATSLAAYFDTLYLPLFSVLLSHPRAAEKAANPAVPQPAAGLSLALLPGQDRVWELALRCLVRLLDASSKEPSVVRAVLVKRFFGIFQLLMHFLPTESKATDSTSQQPGKPQQSSSAQKSLTVYHSEETRLAAFECVQALFLCVEEQLTVVSKSSTLPQELQNLLSMFQSNPAFSLSLGYYLHLLLQCVGGEKNREIRSCCVGGLDQIRRLLSHARMNVIVKLPPSQPTSPFDSVTGDALLLSYFPGMATALFNVLVYDSSKVKSGGWKLQMAAFQLFVDLVRHVVRYVAADDKIVHTIISEKSEIDQKASMMEDIADPASDAQSSQSTDAAMAKLYALLPTPASSTKIQSAAKQRPALQLSKLHPVLQSIMKPLDADWWRETRGNLSNLMQKIFAATQLTQRPEMAQSMLQAALEFLIGTKEDDSTFPILTRYENSIYTTLMPSPSVLHWLEFVIYCTQHQDATIQAQANEAVAQIAAKTEKRSKQVTAVTTIPNTPSLVPLLTSSLSSHLIKLPRLLYTASESAQLTHLKTVHGYILLLGKQRVLFNFMESDLDHILKILYRSFEVEATESKVLERESNSNQNTDTRLIKTSNSTAITIPTYYSFSISHLHSSAAQELSLSILRSLGYYLSIHFGLFIAHLHEQLIRGIQQVEAGNYSASNQLKETVLFINQIILGVGTALRAPEFEHLLSISEIIPHIELLLFEYLNPILWHLPLSASKQNQNLSNADLQNNLLAVSLLVRGIGDMATAMGEDFSSSLMHILYPLFEKLGSRHSTVHQAALVTLYRVAIACGYAEGVDATSLSSAEPVLQAMIVANMDYLVEQMSVELRDLDFSAPQVASGSATSSHPMTLPLVLSALLTKISLSCAQAIIPLLDDVLQRILDRLCQVSWNATEDQEEYLSENDPSVIFEDPSAGQMLSSHMSRLAYLEILRSIVAAIHRIELSTRQESDAAPVSSLFTSANALPLLQPPSQPLLKVEPKVNEYAEVDLMLNLGDDEPAEVVAALKPEPISASVATPKTEENASAPASGMRARLQSLIATRLETSVRAKQEEDWLKHTRAGGDSSSFSIEEEFDEEMEDVPRDTEGKTRAERWYEEREKVRAREEQKKFNSVNGIEDPEADEDLEREEKSHKDEPEIPLTKDQATALSIFQQCRNFLLPGTGPRALALQHATLCIAAESIPVLERVPKSYFPEIAKFWPSLLQSLRLFDNATTAKAPQRVHESLRGAGFENSTVSSLTNVTVDDTTDRHLSQLLSTLTTNATAVAATGADTFTHSTASPLFIQSLQVLALICHTASKFIAGRFANELWPLLQQILHREKNWMREIRVFQLSHKKQSDDKHSAAEANARLKLLPAYKIQKAVLDTLAGLARLPDLSSHHLLSLAQHAAPYLSSLQPLEFQERAILILQSLMQLDRDMVWFVLWKLTPEVAHKPMDAVSIQSSTFLSHPCFRQTFQNFNAHLLLNHRVTSQTFEAAEESNNPYEHNVRTLLDNLNSSSLPRPKLSLF